MQDIMDSTFARGEKEFRDGNFAETAKILAESLQTKHSLSHSILLAEALSKLMKHQEAIAVIQEAYQHLPIQGAEKEKADLLWRMGKLERALSKFELALQHLQSAKDKAAGVFSEKELNELEQDLCDTKWEISKKEGPNRSVEYSSQGKLMEQRKMFKEAIELYTKSLEQEPKSVTFFQRGRCWHSIGEYRKAIEDFGKSLEIRRAGMDKSSLYPILYYMGKCYLETGDYENSVKCLKEGTEYSNRSYYSEDHDLIVSTLEISQQRLRVYDEIKNKYPQHETRNAEEIEEEKKFALEVFANIESFNKAEGRIWHLVEISWLKAWAQYLDITLSIIESYTEIRKREYPGPIFNTFLLENEAIMLDPDPIKSYTNRPIKAELRENKDFVLIPHELWVKWEKVYGGLDIKRFTYWIPEKNTLIIDIYLQKLNVVIRPLEKWMSCNGTGTVFAGKRETVKELREKIERILAKQVSDKGISLENKYKMRMWKVDEEINTEDLDRAIKRVRYNPGTTREIDGKLLDESACIEEAGLGGAEANVLVEIVEKSAPFIFREPKIIKPRYYDGDTAASEEELKKHVQVEGLTFCNIPLKAILPSNANKGRTGIENIGNTCYMNSGLQCLSHCTELTKYFLLCLYKNEINVDNPLGQKGDFAKAYADTLDSLWITSASNLSINALSLKKQIVLKAGHFRGPSQQDAQELILHILDGLHEDLNRVKEKPYIPDRDFDGRPDHILSQEQWETYLARNRSIIVDLFAGQFKSRIQCPNCKDVSVRFEPFMALSVSIPQVMAARILFVYSDPTKGAVNIELTISESNSLEAISSRIKQALKLPENARIAYFVGTIPDKLKYVPPTASCCNITAFKGSLYAYEYYAEDIPVSDLYFMQVTIKYTMSSGFFMTSVRQLERPIVVPIPKTATIQALRLAIFSKLKGLLNIPLHQQRAGLNSQYAAVFSDRPQPYTIEIVNNRRKAVKYYFMPEYAPCEYCSGDMHSGNCSLDFKSEDKVRISQMLGLIKDGRELKFCVVATEGAPHLNHAKTLEFFSKASIVKKFQAATSRFRITLEDCLELFSKEEQLDENNMWHCSKCKKNVQAIKKMTLYKLPRILIVQLKRFKQRVNPLWVSSGKVTEFVEYPTKDLDMRKFVLGNADPANNLYDLFGVSSHYGELSGGHYVASCYNPVFGKWLRFNDEHVERATEEDIVTNLAYVLFYHRVDSS